MGAGVELVVDVVVGVDDDDYGKVVSIAITASRTSTVARSSRRKHRSRAAFRLPNIGHRYVALARRVSLLSRLTEVEGGVLLEVNASREDEVDVVSGDDVCDEDVRAEEVVGVEKSEEESEVEEEEEKDDDEAIGVVEVGMKVDVDVLSPREELDVEEVLTLEEVGAAVLLAWLLDPPPAVPDGDLSRAIYPYTPESEFPHLLSGYPGQSWSQSEVLL